jgi:hypothetical protein
MSLINDLSDRISTHEHVSNWKRAKEYTSSGISGVHFGMFKSQATDPDLASFDAEAFQGRTVYTGCMCDSTELANSCYLFSTVICTLI